MSKIHIKQGKVAYILCLLFSIIVVVSSGSTPVTWTSSPHFIAGRFSYTSGGTYPQLYTVIYNTTLSASPTRMVAFGIVDFNFKLSNPNFYFFLSLYNLGNNGFQVYIDAWDQTYWLAAMKMSYVTVDPAFTQPFSISWFTVTQSAGSYVQGPFSMSYYVNFTQSTGVILNLNHDNAMLAFQHIFDITDISNGCFNINIDFDVYNQSYYKVAISTQCPLKLYTFGFSRIIFDRTAIQNLGYCYFQYGELEAYNSNTSNLTFTTDPFFPQNFMLGMKNFYVNGQSAFKFASSIASTTSVTTSMTFNYLSFMYWSFKLRVCPAGYPYFDAETLMCFDTCPDGLYPVTATTMCLPCNYTCLTCSSFNVCTNCNTTTNRYQNGTECPPKPGYFDNQTTIAVLCSEVMANCKECTSGTVCTSCQVGYYVNSNNCASCSSNFDKCANCSKISGAVVCYSCITGYNLDPTNTSCILSCDDPNCASCLSSISNCTSCKNGYQMISGLCTSVCGDGIKVGTQQCDDNNNVDGDGCNADCTIGNNNNCSASTPYIKPPNNTCLSTCPEGTFPNSTTFICDSCLYSCQTCSNLTVCLSCNTSNHWTLNNATCQAMPGYFDNNTVVAPACVSPCATCSSQASCVTCVNGYYISGSSCLECSSAISNCNECSSASICSSCDAGYIVNTTTHICDVVPCDDVNCAACPISQSVCTNCSSGYQLNSGSCHSVCGDGIKVGTQECDDGNHVDGDGCNADCTNGNNHNCSASSPYINPPNTSCLSTCPSGSFPNSTSFTCDLCHYSCRTCSNLTICLSCNATNHWTLTNSTCSPAPGYFDNNTSVAPACVSPCATCTSQTSCVTCVTGYYSSGSTCLQCSSAINNCAACSGSTPVCSKCVAGYIVNITTNQCDVTPCEDINCIQCPNSYSICTNCASGYQVVSGSCQNICGDFVVVTGQQCDDGNTNGKDGCSASCKVEPNFQCQSSPTQPQGSACYYIGTLDLKTIQISKIPNQNTIQIQLDVQPADLSVLNSIDFMSMINVQSSVPISNYDIIRSPNGTVTIAFDYQEDIHGQSINVTVNPANSGNLILARAQSTTSSIIIIPDDNQAAYFYPPDVYKLQNILSKVASGIVAMTLFFFLLGIISGKIIGVEMMAVVQVSFFSLVSLSSLNPCFAALASLWLVNGYNQLKLSSVLQDPLTPRPPKGIGMFSRFIENFNFMLAIIFIPLLVSLIAFILSKTVMKNTPKVQIVAKRALGEYTFMGLMFAAYLISVSLALEILFGLKNMGDLIGKASLIQCILLALLLLVYFVFLLIKPQFFGQFTQQFKTDKVSSKFYNAMIVQRILVGVGFVVLLKVKIQLVLPLALFFLIGLFITVKFPYKNKKHNLRQIANMVIAIIVGAIYLVYEITNDKTRNTSKIFFYLPFIVCGLLALCVVYNGAAILYSIYEFIKALKNGDNSPQLEKQQLQFMKQQRKQTMGFMQGPLSPSNLRANLKQDADSPQFLRNILKIDDMKKQIKLNTSISENAPIDSLMLLNNEENAVEMINQYDAI